VPILNVCDEELADLQARKRLLSRRIAAQRNELSHGLEGLRRPLHAFDTAREVGARLREHGPAIAMVLAPLLFLLRRPLAGGVGIATRLIQRATRWWTLWKLGSKLFSNLPDWNKKRYAR
jgi:hypothetical protein